MASDVSAVLLLVSLPSGGNRLATSFRPLGGVPGLLDTPPWVGNCVMSIAKCPPSGISITGVVVRRCFQNMLFSGRSSTMPNIFKKSTGSNGGMSCSTTCMSRKPTFPAIPMGTRADRMNLVDPPIPVAVNCNVGKSVTDRPSSFNLASRHSNACLPITPCCAPVSTSAMPGFTCRPMNGAEVFDASSCETPFVPKRQGFTDTKRPTT